jgi:hypothetical protein
MEKIMQMLKLTSKKALYSVHYTSICKNLSIYAIYAIVRTYLDEANLIL